MSLPTQAENHHPAISTLRVPPFYFIVTFWGARYRKWFCRYALPSLLAPNNIPALRHLKECRFLICTTGRDWARLQGEPIFALLKEYMAPVFVESRPSPVYEHKYARMSRGHEALTVACHQARACAIYFAPDTLVPDGCVAEAQRLLVAGKRVVLCTAIRFDMDGVEAELASRGLLKPGLPLVLPRRDAVEIGLRNLHPESVAGYWSAPNFGALSWEHTRTDFPVCCFWDVPGEDGVVIHTHNWAPFMIDFSSLSVHDTQPLQRWSIDGDYIHRNFGQAKLGEAVYVVDDSDEVILLGLTPRNEMVPPTKAGWLKSLPVVGEWTKGCLINQVVFDTYTDPLRRKIYSICVKWHSREVSSAWTAVEARAKKIMARYTQYDLRPAYLIAEIKSSQHPIDLLLSRRLLVLFSSLLIFWILLPARRFVHRSVARLSSYAYAIWQAFMGDPVQQARIRSGVRLMAAATQYNVHPRSQIAALRSSGDVIDFLLSPRVLGFLWYVSVYWIFLSVRRFTDHWFPRVCSWPDAIRRTCKARIRSGVRLMEASTQYNVHPRSQIAALRSSRDCIDFLLSPRVLGFLWYVSVYWIFLSVRRFTDHWFPRVCSYAHAIRWACKGDPVQQARIRNRVRLIVSIFSKTQ